MPAEAHIAPVWKKQKLLVSILFLAFSLPFFWDGAVGYHRKNDRYKVWKTYADAGRSDDWTAEAARRGWDEKEWPDWVQEHGHAKNLPDIPFPPGKITEQYVCAVLCLVIGGIILAYWFSQIHGVIRTDEEAVHTPKGTRVPFSAITGVGKKKWDSKGIAKVRYELDGRKGEFIVDDYKYDTEPSRKILAEIEEKLLARTAESLQ